MGNVYTHTVKAAKKDIEVTRDFLIEKGLNYIESPMIEMEDGSDGKIFIWFATSCDDMEELMEKIGGKYEK